MRETFIEHEFNEDGRNKITVINGILSEYRAQGFKLSLRQLYYQLVARDYIENSQRSYKRIGSLVSTARQSGYIDWDMIEDRNRETVIAAHWESPAEIVEAAARQFKIDKWADQPYHVEVLVEKDALSGVLEPVCRDLDIGITANKGYSSSSMMYEIAKRLVGKVEAGKYLYIIYLGDHDPSGIDMTRDITDRLGLYSYYAEIEVARLALNYDQVERWSPPENPAKESDSRFISYVSKYGYSSWELDAIEPRQLADLVITAVNRLIDRDLWTAAQELESEYKKELLEFVENYKNGE